jgi:Na+-transporting NADH:ubiquinone oxidoreductase subunit A
MFSGLDKVAVTTFEGPHPAGNVGVQIHHTLPVNKGEVVWTMHAEDVANLGETLTTGVYTTKRTVSAAGSEHPSPKYFQTNLGCELTALTAGHQGDATRFISGNPLTGTHAAADGYLGGLDHQVTLLPEGNEPKFLLTSGWLSPGLDKFSLSKSYPTWLMPKSKEFVMDTNTGGEERAFVVTGQYEPVFPFDIYPVQLIKSILANDIDAMEKLGIYEVAPEDFALCEYACTSKIDVQEIVRDGLDNLKKELG